MLKLLLIAICCCSSFAFARELDFRLAGKPQKTLEEAELSTFAAATPLEVYEPHEQRNVTYLAYPLIPILDAIYGQDWKRREEILFTCIDGYQPSIPVAAFLAGHAYLAFKRKDQAEFSLINKLQANEKIALGPLYLVWDNIKEPSLKAEGASQWPYQLSGIDLISFQSRFQAMAPAAGAPGEVTQGFLEFRKSCTNCHRINGVGGDKSIELNYPLSVSEYYRPGFLERWIDQPQKMRWNSPMPPFNPLHPKRQQAIAAIVRYLEHMAQHKTAPAASQP